MMKKKILNIIFVIFVIYIFSNFKVLANEYSEGSEGASNDGIVEGCVSGWCWLDFEGIRITFYHKNGSKISKSLDFYNSNQKEGYTYKSFINTKFFIPALYGSKIDYINSKTSFINYQFWPNNKSFNHIFNNRGISFIQDLYETGASKNVFNEKIGLSDKNQIMKKLGSYESDFFSGYSMTFDDMLSPSNIDKYYMIVEPTTVIIKSGKYYYGTYYELQQIYLDYVSTGKDFGSAKSLFKSGAGWGSSHFGEALYLTSDANIGGSGDLKNLLDKLKKETSYSNVNNAYGIGVFWFGNLNECNEDSIDYNPETGKCGFTTKDSCTVKSPVVEPCTGAIVYEYQGCPLNNSSIVVDNKITGDTVCQINCNEKYYIATWTLNNSFKKLSNDGVLAGAYFPINGPTVWHKKACDYESNLNYFIKQADKKIDSCTTYVCNCEEGEDPKDCCGLVTDISCVNAWTTYKNKITGQCNSVLNTWNSLDSEQDAKKDNLKDGNLTVFSDYKLQAIKTGETEYDIDGYEYGYKNMFIYQLSSNINKYISINNVFNDISGKKTDKNYDNGQPMATTPINADPDLSHTYYADFKNILSTSFSNILKNKGVTVNTTLSWNCPYKIKGRNTKNSTCSEDCGNPDISFNIPNLRIVYRPISLSNPFPGYSGTGRKTGYNWTSDDVEQYILNNRGVSSEKVYTEKEPLYVIELDSTKIKQIREYNDKNSYDDFTLSCTEGEGTECLSNFLRGKISGISNLLSGGTCSDITQKNYNFYKCADNIPLNE